MEWIKDEDDFTMPINCLQHINKHEHLSRFNALLAGPCDDALRGMDRTELCPEGS